MQLLFTLLCFGGLAFMFFCIQRQQEKMFNLMQEEHAQIRTLLRAMEARMDMVEEEALGLQPERTDQATPVDFSLKPGATVAQASEMLRAAEGFRSLDLDSDRERRRLGKKLPDLKY